MGSTAFWFRLLVLVLTITAGWCSQPEFVENIQNLTVPLGKDATFTCHVRNLAGYRVGWVKADNKAIQAIHMHVITHNRRVRVWHRERTAWSLQIRGVQQEDRGTYMCQVNSDPVISQYGYLNVVVPPDIVTAESSGDLVIPEGGSGELICRARGFPSPEIRWRREDGRLITLLTDRNGTPAERHVDVFEGEVLKLWKVKRADTGSYLCIASNGLPPSVSKTVHVQVQFHPVVKVQHQLHGVPLGSDVTLACHVEALPKSINFWIRKPNEMISTGSKYEMTEETDSPYSVWMRLTIRNFHPFDAGQYYCTAKNPIGQVQREIRVYEVRLTSEAEMEPDDRTGVMYSSPDQPGRDVQSSLPPASTSSRGTLQQPPATPPIVQEPSPSSSNRLYSLTINVLVLIALCLPIVLAHILQ